MEKTIYFIFMLFYFYLVLDNYFEKKEMRKTIENQEKIIISLSETRITALKIKEILEECKKLKN